MASEYPNSMISTPPIDTREDRNMLNMRQGTENHMEIATKRRLAREAAEKEFDQVLKAEDKKMYELKNVQHADNSQLRAAWEERENVMKAATRTLTRAYGAAETAYRNELAELKQG